MNRPHKPVKIRIDLRIEGVGEEAHEYQHCPISMATGSGDKCPLTMNDCRYGLTEVEVPIDCPMKGGKELLMRFTAIKG